MLANGGFKAGGRAGWFAGWEQVRRYRGRAWNGRVVGDNVEKHGGASSLRLENAVDDIVRVSQNVPVTEPGNGFTVSGTYRLSAWLKLSLDRI